MDFLIWNAAPGYKGNQLQPARAYFAEQDAKPFLERCDAVLAASA